MDVNTKTLERIRKLLALANDKGATEAEAALAAEKAAELMAVHNISIATAELGGQAMEGRVKEGQEASSRKWAPTLVKAIAEICNISTEFRYRGPNTITGYELIGRSSAVQTAKMLIEYLSQAISRLERDYDGPGERRYFGRGCADRIVERLHERHERDIKEQKRKAEEENERHKTAGTANALVPVMEDWEQKERDFNEDFRCGRPAGSTTAARLEAEARSKQNAERRDALEKRTQQLMVMVPGLSYAEAWYRVNGFSDERAKKMADDFVKSSSKSWKQSSRQHRAESLKKYDPAWKAGRSAGEDVSLNQQVDKK